MAGVSESGVHGLCSPFQRHKRSCYNFSTSHTAFTTLRPSVNSRDNGGDFLRPPTDLLTSVVRDVFHQQCDWGGQFNMEENGIVPKCEDLIYSLALKSKGEPYPPSNTPWNLYFLGTDSVPYRTEGGRASWRHVLRRPGGHPSPYAPSG